MALRFWVKDLSNAWVGVESPRLLPGFPHATLSGRYLNVALTGADVCPRRVVSVG
ncbi:MAG: hypothetical protein R3E82_01220 [Pseudomonadales bacterium]|nr:hypothetical protein [Pseudomonadales bacterium]